MMDLGQQLYLADGNPLGGLVMLVFMVVVYLAVTFPLYTIAQKMNEENAWMAFVPIAQAFLVISMAGREWWWFILLLIPLINIVVAIILWMAIAENLGQPSWMGILMIVPLLNLGLLYYWAFGPIAATR
jgi:hypothetical protein